MAESQYSHTDDARWYNNEAYSGWLRLRHYVYGTELKKKKNLMEWFIQQVKDRTECFDDHCPCRKANCSRQHAGTGLSSPCYTPIWEQTGEGSWHYWLGREANSVNATIDVIYPMMCAHWKAAMAIQSCSS